MIDGYNAVHDGLNNSDEQDLHIKKRSYRKINLIP